MLRYFFLLGILVLGLQVKTQVLYHRATIHLNGAHDLHLLQELGVAMDHGDHKAGLTFTSDFSEQELAIARAGGWKVDLLLEDVGQFYRDQNDPTSHRYVGTPKNAECVPEGFSFATPQNYHGGSMGGFLTYSELLTELDEMYAYCQANGLDIMTPRADNIDPENPTDFQTFEGRYQQWIKLSDQPTLADDTEPEILYTALHHAREPASMQQLVFFLWYLIENYERNPEVKAIVDNNELYFIPCLNPDGYLYNETIAPNGGGLWRKNRRDGVGVDLNRNYSYLTPEGEEQWGTSGTNPDPGSETYPGTGPFSEPETRAVRYFVETHDFQIALNNHTHGELLLYPFGYARDTETPDDFLFSQISAAMVRTNGYDNIISADLYPASGDSDDFMYGMLTTAKGGARDPVFAMTPEIGYSFWPAQADIEGICREMLIHNLTAAQALSNFGLIRADVPQKVNTLSFFLPYTLTRYGFSEGTLTVRFTPVSSNIATTAFETPQTGLQQGGELFSTSLIQLAESIQEGDSIIFELGVDNGKFYVGDRYAIVFGEAINVFTEMADNLDAWTTDGDWGIALGVHHESSPNSSVTDSPAGRYANDAVNTLRLVDPIDLTDPRIVAADLQFWATWNIEDDYDQVQLEVSIDGGQSWTPQCGMYTEPGALTQLTPDEPVYDGRQTEWVQEHIPLTDYLGEEVLLRFELSSDSNLALDGFYFDALQVDILRGTATGTRQVLKEPVRLWPNPTQNELRVATELRNYDYQLLNPLGQQLLSATGLSGTHRIDLSSLPNGIYLLQIYHAGQQRTEKVVKE